MVSLHSSQSSPILDTEVLATIDRLSGENSSLQTRALYIPVNNATMK